MYDIIIVGAGPAGLTAALYALRANKKVLVLEASSYGGKIINAKTVENYPAIETISGFDFATNLYNQVKKLGCEIKYETVLKVDENKNVTTNKDTYSAKAVIIATGLINKKLNVSKADEYLGRGVSYCAVCDGNFFKGKTVAVVGDEKNALDDAIYLSELSTKVYLIISKDEPSAEEDLIHKVKTTKNIEIVNNSQITNILGDTTLSKIEINNDKLIDVDGLFIAIGFVPSNDAFANVVELNNRGYIITTDTVKTKIKGIYVAGDNRDKELRQLTTAVNDGAIAATIAIKEMYEKWKGDL